MAKKLITQLPNKRIFFLDTTLRDGEQAPGYSMNASEKLRMAQQLESLGVDVIEAGFPAASEGDAESVSLIAREMRKSSVAALARAIPSDIELAAQSLRDAKHPRLHVFMATSDLHLDCKLHLSRSEALDRISSAIQLAKSLCPEVEFSAEDASRTNPAFLHQVVSTAIAAGADVIDLPDTVGYATPQEISDMVHGVINAVPEIQNHTLAIHCHNDLGLAVANTLAALQAGASQAECTLCGIGERAGNAALEEVVMALNTRQNFYHLVSAIKTEEILRSSHLLSSITGIKPSPSKAIVGRNAFAHESGIHQHGILSNAATYEIMKPESIGKMDLSLVLGKHSGRHAVVRHLLELGFDELSDAQTDAVFSAFKKLADRKKEVTDKDLVALTENLVQIPEAGQWKLDHFVINSGNTMTSTACVTLSHNGRKFEEVATGNGPIYAAFRAIERIVKHPFTLLDYGLEAVTERRDALGEARVKISDGNGIFRGRGVSTDVIEASIFACVVAVNAMLRGQISQN